MRTSLFIEIEERDITPASNSSAICGRILIDTSPDLRYQALREGIGRVDAVLFTHTHADHVFGLDDLRSFNFINNSTIDIYAGEESAAELEHRFNYAFFPDPNYEGGAAPRLKLHRIVPLHPIEVCGAKVLPLALKHGSMNVLGFRIKNFAYLTDCSFIPEESREQLHGLDSILIDGLRYRPHKTHFTHEQAVAEIEKIRPKISYLTHISHEVEHEAGNAKLRELTKLPVEIAYDGLTLDG